jgi:hypothetical protein
VGLSYYHSRFILSQVSLIANCPSSVLISGSLGLLACHLFKAAFSVSSIRPTESPS